MDYDKIDWKKPQPVPRFMRQMLHLFFSEITYLGIYQDRYVDGTNKKSSHAEGRALDIHLNAFDFKQLVVGNLLSRMLERRAKELGIDNVIWNREIWSQEHPSWRPYTGRKKHEDHVHVEFTREGSQDYKSSQVFMFLQELVVIKKIIESLHHDRSYSI